MTKSHEETWEYDAEETAVMRLPRLPGRHTGGAFAGHIAEMYGSEDEMVERGKLAAAAPAMARLLLQYERSCSCPSLEKHFEGCEWLAVMRAAGVVA